MQDLPMLPFGVSDFTKIISNNLLYVDKTDLVYKLASQFAPIVLSRPRRFGKSLLVSTFEALFNGQKELFKGLKIYDLWQDDNKYKVLRLDFSETIANTYEQFVENFNQILKSNFDKLGIEVSKPRTNLPEDYFCNFINNCNECEVVLLIDNYDAPYKGFLEQQLEFQKVEYTISSFFRLVKSHDAQIRFVFLTGCLDLDTTFEFLDYNCLMDISSNDAYRSILGITDEELNLYFKDYLIEASKKLNTNVDNLKQQLKIECEQKSFGDTKLFVYSPVSILNFLKKLQ